MDRIKLLCSVFAVDLYAYAVMNNHYHIVVKISVNSARNWSDDEVAQRWMQLFSGSQVAHRFLANQELDKFQKMYLAELISTWRHRLSDLSWFMRCLNEPIARMANSEDQCTGRFWEGRFKSQALLDERAVLACMAYVDLNPVRAAIAKTPEQSDYTSIQERILEPTSAFLKPFADHETDGIPFCLKDYLELVDWGGREIKDRKRGHIPSHSPPILTRLGMDAAPVLDYLSKTNQPVFGALGPVSRMRVFAQSVGRRFVKGQTLGRRLYPEWA